MRKKTASKRDLFSQVTLTLFALVVISGGFFAWTIYKDYVGAFGGTAYPKRELPRQATNRQNAEAAEKAADARAEWGQMGDFFGGALNPVFGFVSVIALFLTILYQARELKLSTEELRKSAGALDAQNAAIEHQRFEQTFFAWLENYREILSEIRSHDTAGRGALHLWLRTANFCDRIWGDLRDRRISPHVDAIYIRGWSSTAQAVAALPPEGYLEAAKSALRAWEDLYTNSEHEYQLDGLFRVIFNLLRWIHSQHETRLSPAQKWLYVSIVRAQLSWIELAYLFYNGHTQRGEKFRVIANRYALFDNLNFDSDPAIRIVKECPPDTVGYTPSAYDSALARKAMGLPESAEDALALAAKGPHQEQA